MPNPIRKTLETMDNMMNVFATLPVQIYITTTEHNIERNRRKEKQRNLIPPEPLSRQRRLTLPLPDPAEYADSKNSTQRQRKSGWFGSSSSSSTSNNTNSTTTTTGGKRTGHQEEVVQCTFEQSQSALMKLPVEIREMIWKEVVCGGEAGKVDIMWDGGLTTTTTTTTYGLVCLRGDGERVDGSGEQGYGLGVMGLLRCCRVVYSEVIPLVYSTPTFTFSNSQPLTIVLAFLGALLPHHVQQIRHLDLSPITRWHIHPTDPPDDPEWRREELNYAWLRAVPVRWQLPNGVSMWKEVETSRRNLLGDAGRAGGLSVGWAIDEVLKKMEGIKLGSVEGWEVGRIEWKYRC